jgi:hypothetical protein
VRIGFTGHQGLAPDISRLVDRAVRAFLGRHEPPLVGITMCGPGADQLFARAVLELGGSLHVVVPATKYRDGFDDEQARRGYDELTSKAISTQVLPYVESTELAHMSGGKAVVLACDLLVAVWDGQPSRGYGGTADVVAFAERRRVPVEVIWPPGARRD